MKNFDSLKCHSLNELKNEIMEGMPLDKISKKDIKWCAKKWYFIMALTHGKKLKEEVFESSECYYGHLIAKLEERIRALGGKVVPMESIEIPT